MQRTLTLTLTIALILTLALLATVAVAAPAVAQEATPDTDTSCGDGFVVTSDGLGCLREATLIERLSGATCAPDGEPASALLSPDRTECLRVQAPSALLPAAPCTTNTQPGFDGRCVSAPDIVTTASPRRCLDPEGTLDGVILSRSLRCVAQADLSVERTRLVSVVDPARTPSPGTPSLTVSLCPPGFAAVAQGCEGQVVQPDTLVGREQVEDFRAPCPGEFVDTGDACERFISDPTGIEIVRSSGASEFLCNNTSVAPGLEPQCAATARLVLSTAEGPRPPVGPCPEGFVAGSTSCEKPGLSVPVFADPVLVDLPAGETLTCPIYHSLAEGPLCVSTTQWPGVAAQCADGAAIGIDGQQWCELDHEPLLDVTTSLDCAVGALSIVDLWCTAPPLDLAPTACPPGYGLAGEGLCSANDTNCGDRALVPVEELLLAGSSVCSVGPSSSSTTFAGSCAIGEFISEFGNCRIDRADGPRATTCHGRIVTVDLGAGQTPTALNDVIMGTSGDDTIAAGDGDDIICGMGGHDTIFGQAGDDVILGDSGDDRLRGGPGNDVLFGGTGADDLNGSAGDDLVFGQAGDDPAVRGGTGDDYVSGGDGDDALVAGNGGTDRVLGGNGDDKVTGGPRPDFVEGGPGTNEVKGNGGNDMVFGSPLSELLGGPGIDVLRGGSECNGGTTGLRDDGSLPDELDYAAGCEVVLNVP